LPPGPAGGQPYTRSQHGYPPGAPHVPGAPPPHDLRESDQQWLLGSVDEDAFERARGEQDDPLVGRTVDRYRILGLIGKGGMGKVYHAEHAHMHRACAFKVMHADVALNPDYVTRFQREAQATSRFRHPNAVDVHDFGRIGRNTFFMALELIRGEQLSDRLQREGPLPLREVVEIATQVLDVLGAAHNSGIVHRDLKPDNIMLQTTGTWRNQVKVLDFGIAKVAHAKGTVAEFQTRAGEFFGTAEYASPEQCGGDPVDARSDIYSLGIILYELLTGRTPFHADTPQGYLALHMAYEPPPFAEANPGVSIPDAVERVVMRCLAKRATDRYETASALADALTQAAGYRPRFTVDEDGVQLASEHLAPAAHPRTTRWLVTVGALAIAAAGAWFGWRSLSGEPGPDPAVEQQAQREREALRERELELERERQAFTAAQEEQRRREAEAALAEERRREEDAALAEERRRQAEATRAAELERERAERERDVAETAEAREAASSLLRAVAKLAERADAIRAATVAGGIVARAGEELGAGERALTAGDVPEADARLRTAEALFRQAIELTEQALGESVGAVRAEVEALRERAETEGVDGQAPDELAGARAELDSARATQQRLGLHPETLVSWQRARDALRAAIDLASFRVAGRAYRIELTTLVGRLAGLRKATTAARHAAEAAGATRHAPDRFAEAFRTQANAEARVERVTARLRDEDPVDESEHAEHSSSLGTAEQQLRTAGLGFARAEQEARAVVALREARAAYDAERQRLDAARTAWRQARETAEAEGRDLEAADSTVAAAQEVVARAASDAKRDEADVVSAARDLLVRARGLYGKATVLAGGEAPTATDAEAEAGSVESLLEAYKRAVEAKDLTALEPLFAEFSSWEAGYRELFGAMDAAYTVLLEPIEQVEDDIAHTWATRLVSVRGQSGTPARTKLIVVREAGAWKISRVER
jgi:hypothetical protein